MKRLSSVVRLTLALGLWAPLAAYAQDDEGGDIQFAPDEDAAAPKPVAPATSAAPATPAPEAAPDSAPTEPLNVPTQPADDAVGDGNVKIRVRGKTPDRVFGTYRVRVNYNQPDFNDGLKFYDEAYGKASNYPSIDADWFAWDWYVTLGLKFGLGYYVDDGHALKAKTAGKAREDLTKDDVEKDDNGKTSLTLVPLQASLAAEMTPFSGKWLVIDGWVGVERLYWQEVRTGGSASTTAAMIEETATDNKDETLTNKGWKNGTVIGASANILLNPVDEQGAASMRGSMGLGFIYLSPFVEIVRTRDKDGASFGRKVLGLGFTFESTK